MQFRYCPVVLYLLSVFAMGQSPANGSPSAQSPIHGIKILAFSFDSSASPQRIQLEFMNDSPANITAWGYCVKAEKVKDDDPSQEFCTLVDPMPVVVDKQVQERITSRSVAGDCPDCNFIHPGEHKILSSNFSWPVKNPEIQVNFIAYSNGQAEASGPEGSSNWRHISAARHDLLKSTQELVHLGAKILSDSTNQHPAASMVNELQSRGKNDRFLEATLRLFKQPEWRHANDKEFIPADERGYLTKFVTEQEFKAAEFSKYQISEDGQ